MSEITNEQIDRVLFQVFNFIDRSEVWTLARQEAEPLRQAVRMGLSESTSKAWTYDGLSSYAGVTIRFEILDGVHRAILESVSDTGATRNEARQRLIAKIYRGFL